jgi:hypothetical protein
MVGRVFSNHFGYGLRERLTRMTQRRRNRKTIE